MNNPLVSVITIFFNAEKFIEESIQSVIDQSYKNWELILVDDGSSDKSTMIAKRFAQSHPDKIFYVQHYNHENKGMSASRNEGIRNAKGDYISFLDADDIWLPNKLSEQVNLLQKNPEAEMLYGNTIFWYTWDNNYNKKDLLPKLRMKPNRIINPPDLVPMFLSGKTFVPGTCSMILKREVFNEFNFENSFTGLYEDQVFYFKVCLEKKVFVTDRVWDKYRQHEHSETNVAAKKRKLVFFQKNFFDMVLELYV